MNLPETSELIRREADKLRLISMAIATDFYNVAAIVSDLDALTVSCPECGGLMRTYQKFCKGSVDAKGGDHEIRKCTLCGEMEVY